MNQDLASFKSQTECPTLSAPTIDTACFPLIVKYHNEAIQADKKVFKVLAGRRVLDESSSAFT